MANETIGWREMAVVVVSVLAGFSTTALWAIRTTDNERTAERCAQLSAAMAAISEHDNRIEAKVDGALISIGSALTNMDAHRREADVHIGRIGSNESRVNELERKVSALYSSSGARPDSYTGTDARERAKFVDSEFRDLRHEVKAHDRRLDALEVETFGRADGNGVTKPKPEPTPKPKP